MSDYRDTLRLAREVDAIRGELGGVTTREQVEALEARVDGLHTQVSAALKAHTATRPWYTRWLWAWRLWRFDSDASHG